MDCNEILTSLSLLPPTLYSDILLTATFNQHLVARALSLLPPSPSMRVRLSPSGAVLAKEQMRLYSIPAAHAQADEWALVILFCCIQSSLFTF